MFKTAFLLSLTLLFAQIIMGFMNLPGRNLLIIVILPLTLTYIIMALKEIYPSNRINMFEKIMWTISLIVLNYIAGLMYLLFARKRILREYKILFNGTKTFA